MSIPAIFERYPIGSTAYVERRIYLRGKPVTHLYPVSIKAVGRKYITIENENRWVWFAERPWLTIEYGNEHDDRPGYRLFHDSPEIQARLLREAEEAVLAAEANQLDDDLRCRLIEGAVDEASCERIVRFLLDRRLVTWSDLAGAESHHPGQVSPAALRGHLEGRVDGQWQPGGRRHQRQDLVVAGRQVEGRETALAIHPGDRRSPRRVDQIQAL